MPRRRAGQLLDLEVDILRALQRTARDGSSAHGFRLAELLGDDRGRALTAHGTLYRALGRLQDGGLVSAVWEDEAAARIARRPRRKTYSLTAEGANALAAVPLPGTAAPARPATGSA